MPIPATSIVVSGTPNTSQLGVGGTAGNALTYAGLTLQPNQPGWSLTSSQGGPGFVSGTWGYGPSSNRPGGGGGETRAGYDSPAGGYYGGGGGGGSLAETLGLEDPSGSQSQAPAISRSGWLFLGLIALILLGDKKR